MTVELRVNQELDLHTPGQRKTDRLSKRTIYVLCSCVYSDHSVFFTGLADGKILGWRYKSDSSQLYGGIGISPTTQKKGGPLQTIMLGSSTAASSPVQSNPSIKQVMTFAGGHKGAVTFLYYSADHQLLFSGSSDFSVKAISIVWDVNIREAEKPCVQTLIGHGGTITGIITFRGQLFTSSTDCSLRVWKAEEGRSLLLYPWFTCTQVVKSFGANWVTSMSYSSNPHLNEMGELYVGDSSGALSIMKPVIDYSGNRNTISLELLKKFTRSHHLGISNIVHAVKENFIITISSDTTAAVMNSQNGRVFSKIKNPYRVKFTGVLWLADYKEILLTDMTGHVYIYSVYGDKCVLEIDPGFGPISSLSVREGGEFMITSMEGVQFFEIIRQSHFHEYPTHQGPIVSLTFAEPASKKDSLKLLTVSMDNFIRKLDPRDLICLQQFNEKSSEIMSSFYHADFRIMCTGHENGKISLWHLESAHVSTVQAHSNSVTSVTGSSYKSKEYLISAGFDGKIGIWDITTQGAGLTGTITAVTSIQAHPCEILCVKFNATNNSFITAANDGTIKIWDHRPPFRELHSMREHTEAVTCLALDGNFLFSGSDDSTIGIWDVYSRLLLRKLTGHTGPIRDLIMLPEFGFLVSCSRDMTIRMWEYSTERLVSVWGHTTELSCLGYWKEKQMIWAGCETGVLISFDIPDKVFRSPDSGSDSSAPTPRVAKRPSASSSSELLSLPGEMKQSPLDTLILSDRVVGPFSGLKLTTLTQDLAVALDPDAPDVLEGVLIVEVAPESNAAKAGLRARDVIVELEGQSVSRVHEVLALLANENEGLKVNAKIIRYANGQQVNRNVGFTLQ